MVFLKWKVVLERDEESGWFAATVPALPGCISQGKTRKGAMKNIGEAIELHISSLAEDGIPISSGKEVAQIAVRL